MWELERINWSALQLENAESIPENIKVLRKTQDGEVAEKMYWRLEFCLIDHGRVKHDAILVIPSIINALQGANALTRQYFIDWLVQISSSIAQDSNCDEVLKADCFEQIAQGLEIYLYYLEDCTLYELDLLIELLCQCAEYEGKIKERVVWYMQKLLNNDLRSEGISAFINSWLGALAR